MKLKPRARRARRGMDIVDWIEFIICEPFEIFSFYVLETQIEEDPNGAA